MMTAIVYNCNPESLADVDQAEFVDAFENEVRVRYRDLKIDVTFNAGESQITSYSSDDLDADVLHEDEFREWFCNRAEKAFNFCLEAETEARQRS